MVLAFLWLPHWREWLTLYNKQGRKDALLERMQVVFNIMLQFLMQYSVSFKIWLDVDSLVKGVLVSCVVSTLC
jgi:hypothetical protein